MNETVLKRIVITEENWEEELEKVLAYDHPGTDYLLVQFDTLNPLDQCFRTYRVVDLNEGKTEPLYAGEEFPEAIFSCGF